jgi:hypothetical protein
LEEGQPLPSIQILPPSVNLPLSKQSMIRSNTKTPADQKYTPEYIATHLSAPLTWFAIDLEHMGANSTRYGQFHHQDSKTPLLSKKPSMQTHSFWPTTTSFSKPFETFT